MSVKEKQLKEAELKKVSGGSKIYDGGSMTFPDEQLMHKRGPNQEKDGIIPSPYVDEFSNDSKTRDLNTRDFK